ncbi:unnamed protein product [Dibothriocephalus latus]|uniref:Uncharacterized protein n=1 Tax=Dibothriocephalus latus TaxID=60516 RepID=A0A3P6P845_DIBLA|nr:unnamed protein product [Dibothriocephalus latus]
MSRSPRYSPPKAYAKFKKMNADEINNFIDNWPAHALGRTFASSQIAVADGRLRVLTEAETKLNVLRQQVKGLETKLSVMKEEKTELKFLMEKLKNEMAKLEELRRTEADGRKLGIISQNQLQMQLSDMRQSFKDSMRPSESNDDPVKLKIALQYVKLTT